LTFTKICVIIITENKKGIDCMNTLYYEIEGLKNVGTNYGEVEIPENVISLNAVRKKDGIFLQYITTSERKIVWAQDIVNKNCSKIKYILSDEILHVTFVELRDGKTGFSRCSTKDKFNITIGRAVAICHALKKKIPDFI
jgi:hypothetical protein